MSHTLDLLKEHQMVMGKLSELIPLIDAASLRAINALKHGGKLFFMGNGGSAADAQHLAAELIGRFEKERRAISALALTTDTSILTSLSNDYDYSIVFSRQLEALCDSRDVVIGISTSGNSKNILKGVETAKKIGAYTIGFTGEGGGKLKDLVDLCFCVPSNNVARIQEAHIFIGHVICDSVENAIAENHDAQKAIAG